MIKAWRIKHIPTGLYYTPCRKIKCEYGNYIKSNLSKTGKAYIGRRPTLKQIGYFIRTHLNPNTKTHNYDNKELGKTTNMKVRADEWEIEEISQ